MQHATTLIGYKDPLARAYLKGLFRRTTDMTCAAEAETFPGVLDALRGEINFTFVLLDVDMLGGGEDVGLRYLVERYPDCRFVVLVDGDGHPLIDRLLAQGAVGCIPKTLSGDSLIDAFRVVLMGSVYVPQGHIAGRGSAGPTEVHRTDEPLDLTERQVEVLRLLALGHSNREISEILSIAEGTVKVHVNAAFRVLGVHNRVRAAAALRERESELQRSFTPHTSDTH